MRFDNARSTSRWLIGLMLALLVSASLACTRGQRRQGQDTATPPPAAATDTVQPTSAPSGGQPTEEPTSGEPQAAPTLAPTPTQAAAPTVTGTPASDALGDELEALLGSMQATDDAADTLDDLP